MKGLILILVVASIAAPLSFAADSKPATIPIERVLGTWRGFSICSGPRPACKDERVRFFVTRATSGPYDVIQTAEKLVGTSWDTMAVIEMNYDAAKGELYRDREMGTSHGVFRFRLAGDAFDRLEGTLVTLPDSVLGRVIEVSRDTARAPEREPDAVFAPLEWLVGKTWRYTRSTTDTTMHVVETYAWRNDRVAIHVGRRPGGQEAIAYNPVERRLVEWTWSGPSDVLRRPLERADSTGFTIGGTSPDALVRTGDAVYYRRAGASGFMLGPFEPSP